MNEKRKIIKFSAMVMKEHQEIWKLLFYELSDNKGRTYVMNSAAMSISSGHKAKLDFNFF